MFCSPQQTSDLWVGRLASVVVTPETEVVLVHARTGEYPVLMLDEVLAELDVHRAGQLFGAVPHAVQCLVTTASPLAEVTAFGREAVRWRMIPFIY